MESSEICPLAVGVEGVVGLDAVTVFVSGWPDVDVVVLVSAGVAGLGVDVVLTGEVDVVLPADVEAVAAPGFVGRVAVGAFIGPAVGRLRTREVPVDLDFA